MLLGTDCGVYFKVSLQYQMPNAKFDSIIILDAVPTIEAQTARRLKEDIEDASIAAGRPLTVRREKIETVADLRQTLGNLKDELLRNPIYPWIHLDGHGVKEETGFVTANHEYCTWAELNELLTPINVTLGLNIFLILSMCQGGSFATSIRTTDRAPVLALIGPVREISSNDVVADYSPFYTTFIRTNSIKKALNSLDARHSSPLYYRTNAETFFYEVWRSYKHNQCNPASLSARAENIRSKLNADSTPILPDVTTLEAQLLAIEPVQFERFRDHYFMFDLYPENRERFEVTYEAASAYTAS